MVKDFDTKGKEAKSKAGVWPSTAESQFINGPLKPEWVGIFGNKFGALQKALA